MRVLIRSLLCLFGYLMALILSGPGVAQVPAYPSKPVRVIVGFSPGGPTDVIARLVAQKLSDRWAQQVYVENHAGAGGNIAAGLVAKSAADGYTVHVISTGFIVNASLYAKIPYDPVTDFDAITLVAASPNVLVVNPSVPATSVAELVALIKANPGKYSFAAPGIGSTPHLSGERFKLFFNVDMPAVPFPGAAPAITATMGGHTPLAFTALPPAIANVRDGKLRALAVTSAARARTLPEVPTMAEAGVADQEAATLTGIVVPKGTPKEIIDMWYREVARIVALPDVKEHLDDLGFDPVANSPEDFAVQIKQELDKWGKVVHDAKLKIE
jgi:tripartite-type tricarboxylate transporter receptor subunit TctC